MSDNPHSREHIKSIFLNASLYISVQKLSGQFEISQKAAILLAIAEGAHSLGFLSDEDYGLMTNRYKRKLKEVIEETQKKPESSHVPVLTIEQKKDQQLLADKDRQFKGQIKQWNIHSDLNWRIKAVSDAEKWKDKLQSARDLVDWERKRRVRYNIAGRRLSRVWFSSSLS